MKKTIIIAIFIYIGVVICNTYWDSVKKLFYKEQKVELLEFVGIPIEGTKKEFGEKLVEKGFKPIIHNSYTKDTGKNPTAKSKWLEEFNRLIDSSIQYDYEGTFYGEEVYLDIFERKGRMWKVTVYFHEDLTNELKTDLRKKYGRSTGNFDFKVSNTAVIELRRRDKPSFLNHNDTVTTSVLNYIENSYYDKLERERKKDRELDL